MPRALAIQLTVIAVMAAAGSIGLSQDANPPTAQTSDIKAVFQRIDQARQAAEKIRVDGRARDWQGIPEMADPAGDGGEDTSRDLVAAAIAPLQNGLLVMLRTAEKPSTVRFSFYLVFDLVGQDGDDFLLELQPAREAPSLRLYDEHFKSGERVPLQDAKVAIGEVVEAWIPYEELATVLPEEDAGALNGASARPWVRMRCQTWDGRNSRVVDVGPSVASYRLLKTPCRLEQPLSRPASVGPPRQIVRVGLPVAGQWFVSQEPFGGYSHQHVWACDLLVMDRNGMQSVPQESRENADYHAWGRQVFAPISGLVRRARNQFEDGPPQVGSNSGTPANDVYIDSGHGVGVSLVHLQKDSVRVKVGQQVRRSTPIGLVGNSGQSLAPHLHIAVYQSGSASRTLPLALANVRVGLNPVADDPWARDLTAWEPRWGFFVRAIPPAVSSASPPPPLPPSPSR